MSDLVNDILVAVLSVCVPILAGYLVRLINSWTASAKAETASTQGDVLRNHLEEISKAIATAVSYTSQTYVDSLKAAGKFTKEAQKEALQRSLAAALSILTPAAAEFIEETYGDIKEYILPMVEAEVRKQKLETPEIINQTAEPDAAAIAASTAAATAATIAQTAVSQLTSEPTVAEPEE
ncbi:superfamily 6 holin (LLH) [Fusobacterium naviforme]|nr:hypothetical protein F7P78_06175 [Fusobacterium naviforme]PSL10174.1 superfamily 6 holin (LLH) [Fusobacterium naviforme]STO27584.1 Uncharacterised protein [Fusobacterium naviforme]